MTYTLINGAAGQSTLPKDPTSEGSFTLSALPGSDTWHVPKISGNRDDFNGPTYATSLPLSSFKKASVTVSANWASQYAQGGLTFFLPGSIETYTDSEGVTKFKSSPQVWIKTGIELEEGITFASVVAANPYSDWSLLPWKQDKAKIELERVKGSLWVYVTGQDGQRIPIRQLTWVFDQEEEKGDVWVGVFTAMPKPDGSADGGKLDVKFEDFTIEKL